MKRDIRFPTVNFRMAVMDLCELTGFTEREILHNIYEHLNRFFIEHPERERQNWPLYFESEKYKIPHNRALTFIWAIKEGMLPWNQPVDIDQYGRPVPEARVVAFEHFYIRLPDLLLFLSRVLDSDDVEALRGQWKYGVPYDAARVDAASSNELPAQAAPNEHPLKDFQAMLDLQPEELRLSFVSGDRLKAREETKYAPLGSLGLIDSRNGNPTRGQAILIGFATGKPLPNTPANAKAISRLREFFKAHLGVTVDPFVSRGTVTWEPRFDIEDKRKAADERARKEAQHIEFNDSRGHGSVYPFDEEDDETANWINRKIDP
jgi:hypothetical protein